MKRLCKNLLPVILAILVNLLSLGSHGIVMAGTATHASHSSSKVGQGGAGNVSCVSVCIATAPKQVREAEVDSEKDDEDYPDSLYGSNGLTIKQIFHQKHSQDTKIAVSFNPPPGTPAFILNSVFRF